MTKHDVVIIGAGGVGCAVARELSRYNLNITVLEKECDAAGGISGRNSAVVHAGFNNVPGSLMAKLCVEGNRGFETLCRELDIPYKKTGKLLVAFDETDMNALHEIMRQGIRNGCEGLRLVDADEMEKLAPGIGGIGGMYSPETAVFDPFLYCIALAESALENGAVFHFNSEVVAIERNMVKECGGEHTEDCGKEHIGDRFVVKTADGGEYACRFLINCAGLSSGNISKMAGGPAYQIYPCRGEYFILDKVAEELLPMPVYPAPRKGIGGLGVHLTPTTAGNIIIGPSAEYISQIDDLSTTRPIMDDLFAEAKALLPAIERKYIIGSYAGIRPKLAPPEEGGYRDFVIQEEEACPGLINLIGIESPGLTASMPIARKVCSIIGERMPLEEKTDFVAERKGPVRFRDLSEEEQAKLIREDSEFGEIICRCQKVTKREIRNAIENPFGARSISAIKYRAWATTGRCNGGYCLTRIVDMLVNEYGVKPEEITYRSTGSELFSGKVK
ncbi:MAG: NAD(P)/FAD-dependent oxidoreductase [Firmicutes bacterium]|nr:NAD(P)/FAD-dependent oxidoreductase [Bacillota bacterium]